MHTKLWSENLKQGNYLEDLGIDEMTIRMYFKRNSMGSCLQDSSGSGQALANTVMNPWGSIKGEALD
jgi:hypothetical protein